MEKILEVKNLKKIYKNGRGITDISFDIKQGEIIGLLGPNGSGKTTIMKSITGLVGLTKEQLKSVRKISRMISRDNS